MKKILLFLALIFAAASFNQVDAQILNRLRRKAESAIDKAVDKTIDKAVDKATKRVADKYLTKKSTEIAAATGLDVSDLLYWTCPKCGLETNEGNFCTACGEKRPSSGWNCVCGHKGNTGKFCTDCGKTIDGNVASCTINPADTITQEQQELIVAMTASQLGMTTEEFLSMENMSDEEAEAFVQQKAYAKLLKDAQAAEKAQ